MKETSFFRLFIEKIETKNVLLCTNPFYKKKKMITDRPVSIQEQAMRFGTYMGVFWIIKFIFLPLGFSFPLLQLCFVLCTLFVPVLGYLYTRKFRNTCCGGTVSFSRAFLFTVCMYIFAAMLTAVAHYIYFQFIDQGFLMDMYRQQLNETMQMVQGDLANSMEQIMIAFDTVAALTPIQLTFQLISQNVFYGIVLSLPTALLTMRYKK